MPPGPGDGGSPHSTGTVVPETPATVVEAVSPVVGGTPPSPNETVARDLLETLSPGAGGFSPALAGPQGDVISLRTGAVAQPKTRSRLLVEDTPLQRLGLSLSGGLPLQRRLDDELGAPPVERWVPSGFTGQRRTGAGREQARLGGLLDEAFAKLDKEHRTLLHPLQGVSPIIVITNYFEEKLYGELCNDMILQYGSLSSINSRGAHVHSNRVDEFQSLGPTKISYTWSGTERHDRDNGNITPLGVKLLLSREEFLSDYNGLVTNCYNFVGKTGGTMPLHNDVINSPSLSGSDRVVIYSGMGGAVHQSWDRTTRKLVSRVYLPPNSLTVLPQGYFCLYDHAVTDMDQPRFSFTLRKHAVLPSSSIGAGASWKGDVGPVGHAAGVKPRQVVRTPVNVGQWTGSVRGGGGQSSSRADPRPGASLDSAGSQWAGGPYVHPDRRGPLSSGAGPAAPGPQRPRIPDDKDREPLLILRGGGRLSVNAAKSFGGTDCTTVTERTSRITGKLYYKLKYPSNDLARKALSDFMKRKHANDVPQQLQLLWGRTPLELQQMGRQRTNQHSLAGHTAAAINGTPGRWVPGWASPRFNPNRF